jgi:hypothetical protein
VYAESVNLEVARELVTAIIVLAYRIVESEPGKPHADLGRWNKNP